MSSDVINQEFIVFADELIIEAKQQHCVGVKIMKLSYARGLSCLLPAATLNLNNIFLIFEDAMKLNRELKFLSHGWQPDRKSNVFCFGVVLLLSMDKLLFFCLRFDVTNTMASKRSKEGNVQLPVDVRVSKTSVLKFPNGFVRNLSGNSLMWSVSFH